MALQNIFREYDIRGIVEKELTKDIVAEIGFLLGQEIKKRNLTPMAHIGYDARTHSKELFSYLCAGLNSAGIKVLNLGLIPTPVAYFATFNTIDSISCPNSIMITGSHNPPQYNGFKITLDRAPFYGEQIRILGENLLKNIESKSSKIDFNNTESSKINALDSYINYLISSFSHLKNFPYKIALDCGNGVGGVAIKPVLEALNIAYEPLYFEPDGTFPNHHPDPSEEENLNDLKATMKQKNISIGIAYDGDADRLALLSENYNYKGDELAILFARQMKNNGLEPLVIGEVKCSQVMYDEINAIGKAFMYKTGHSNLKVKLKELNAHLAAEMSGHIFFNDRYFGYDDAIYSSLRALELFLASTPNEVESSIKALPTYFSTQEEKIKTSEEQKFIIIQKLKQALQNPPKNFPRIKEIIDIDGLRVVFESGWGLIRASNTTPVLVSRFESSNKKDLETYKNALLDLLKSVQ